MGSRQMPFVLFVIWNLQLINFGLISGRFLYNHGGEKGGMHGGTRRDYFLYRTVVFLLWNLSSLVRLFGGWNLLFGADHLMHRNLILSPG